MTAMLTGAVQVTMGAAILQLELLLVVVECQPGI